LKKEKERGRKEGEEDERSRRREEGGGEINDLHDSLSKLYVM